MSNEKDKKKYTQLEVLSSFRGMLAPESVSTKFQERVLGKKVHTNKLAELVSEKMLTVPTTEEWVDFYHNQKAAAINELMSKGEFNTLTGQQEVSKELQTANLIITSPFSQPAQEKPPPKKTGFMAEQRQAEADRRREVRLAARRKLKWYNLFASDQVKLDGNPGAASFILNIPTVSPATYDVANTLLFLDMVPTNEMSRCTPYMDIKLVSQFGPIQDDIALALTNIKHLLGQTKLGGTPEKLAEAKDKSLGSQQKGQTVSGMELFTSPQTLTAIRGAKFSNDIIDIHRPLLSFLDATINVTSTHGAISFKTLDMKFILHDRSRVSDVADLINPEYYSSIRFHVDYGWSHPEEATNPFGQLVSNLRKSEIYQVYDTSFSFTPEGQVNIDVKTAMAGTRALDNVNIAAGAGVKGITDAQKELAKLAQNIRELIRYVPGLAGKAKTEGITEARGTQILSAAGSPETFLGGKNAAMMQEINDFFKKINKNDLDPSAHKHFKDLKEKAGLIEDTVAKVDTSIGAAVKAVMDRVKDGDDPYWNERTFNALKIGTWKDLRAAQELELKQINLIFKPGGNTNQGLNIKYSLDNEIKVAKQQVRNGKGHLKGLKDALKAVKADYAKKSKNKQTTTLADERYRRQVAEFNKKIADRSAQVKKDEARLNKRSRQKTALEDRKKYLEAALKKNKNNKGRPSMKELGFVSLGKIISEAVLRPLQAESRFDQVQVFYYPINDKAGRMGLKYDNSNDRVSDINDTGANIAGFLINIGDFESEFSSWCKSRGSAEVNLGEFLGLLFNKFTDNPRAEVYGLSDLYYSPRQINPATGKFYTIPTLKPIPTNTTLKDIQREKLKSNDKTTHYKFVQPNIECYVEAKTSKSAKTIMRIHIFDKAASPYRTQEDIYKQLVEKNLETGDPKNLEKVKEIISDAGKASAAGKKPSEEAKYYPVGVKEFKKFLFDTMPSITYGTNNSAIISANFTSVQDKQLANVALLKMGKSSPTAPPGVNDGAVPLRVRPTVLDVNMLGLPSLEFAQTFYIDFGTNTTIDNIYSITGLTHTFAPGKFETTAKFVGRDSWGQYMNFAREVGVKGE